MKNILMLILFSFIVGSSQAFAVREGGGGDAYVADFVSAMNTVVLWMNQNGKSLKPAVNPTEFADALDPRRIQSTVEKLIYRGSEVDADYYSDTDLTRINRLRWGTIEKQAEKMRLATHENFRRMKARGIKVDDGLYEISRQIDFNLIASKCQNCSGDDPFALWRKTFYGADPVDFSSLKNKKYLWVNKRSPIGGVGDWAMTMSLYFDNSDLVPRAIGETLLWSYRNLPNYISYDHEIKFAQSIQEERENVTGKTEKVIYFHDTNGPKYRQSFRLIGDKIVTSLDFHGLQFA